MEPSNKRLEAFQPRWWPGIVVIAGMAVAWIFIWFRFEEDQASRVLLILVTLFIGSALLLAWALFFSRFHSGTRLKIFGLLLGGAGLFFSCFRFSQFSGNMLPIYEWRWRDRTLPPVGVQDPRQNIGKTDHFLARLSFPQFLGPNRDCIIPGPALATDWGKQPPQQLWRQSIGAAWSGFAIAGKRAVTQEQRDENEAVVCYDLLTGSVFWLHTDPGHYHTAIAGEGPRATPAIHIGKVYTLGANGTLNCLELESGKKLWQRNIAIDAGLGFDEPIDQTGASKKRNKAKEWGYTSSPLIADNKVIVSAGGENGKSLIAYHAVTGEEIWSGGNSRAGYSSARLAKFDGQNQILIFNQDGLAAHSPEDGVVLWEFRWDAAFPHVSIPLVLPNDQILLSLGYGQGSKLLQVDSNGVRFSAAEMWSSTRMKAKFTNLIFHNDHIFGLDDGIFACIDLERGRRKWKDGRYGHGQILLRGSHIVVMAENGDVVLLEANPEKQVELTKFTALDGKTWNPPTLADQYLLVRNHREAACYKLPLANPTRVAAQ